MKIIDHAFGITLLWFLLGASAGFFTLYSIKFLQQFMANVLQYRLIGPIRAVSAAGTAAVLLFVFANNMLPVLLSFLYPVLLRKINWTPPLSENKLNWYLSSYSKLCGFLIGFFDLGGTLTVAYIEGGQALIERLIAYSWLHGPLEFLFVLLAVAEPLRLTATRNVGRKNLRLILICVMGLFACALVEVYLGV